MALMSRRMFISSTVLAGVSFLTGVGRRQSASAQGTAPALVTSDLKQNRPPSDGLQFFGMVNIHGQDEVMTVSLHNLRGEKIYSVDLPQEV